MTRRAGLECPDCKHRRWNPPDTEPCSCGVPEDRVFFILSGPNNATVNGWTGQSPKLVTEDGRTVLARAWL